jgi:hypothetical protein
LGRKSEHSPPRKRTNADDLFSIADLEAQGLASSPVAFYDFLQNRVVIHFRPKDETDAEAGFDLTLSKKMTYEMVSNPKN